MRFQSDSSSSLTFFNLVKNDLSLRPTIQNYYIIVHILTWSKKIYQATDLLSKLIEMVKVVSPDDVDVFESLVLCCEDCNWDPVVFDMLIKAYVKANMIEQRFRTFRRSVEVGFVPSVVACNFCLNGLVKLKCVDRCWEVYEEGLGVPVEFWIFWFCLREIENTYRFKFLFFIFLIGGVVN